MRTYDEYKQILILWETLENKKEIARITGIPRGTVSDCINRYGDIAGLEAQKEHVTSSPRPLLERICNVPEVRKAYAYLLGMYLGDGYINLTANGRTSRLRIALDKKYPNIVESCRLAAQIILPDNKISLVDNDSYYSVSCFNKHLSVIFPQDGDGPKHEREIKLEVWQQSIVDEFPLEFFRGLYHSDGSRAQNIVKGKNYTRYIFCNVSEDILRLFSDTCDQLGLHWTTKGRNRIERANLIYISKRQDVAYLDSVIGPKS